jgi:hypothetical protein
VHVDELEAAAEAEDWDVAGERALEERELGRIARWIDVFRFGVDLTVTRGVDVATAAEAKTVELLGCWIVRKDRDRFRTCAPDGLEILLARDGIALRRATRQGQGDTGFHKHNGIPFSRDFSV